MRRVCPGTLVRHEQTVRGGTRGYTMSKQSGTSGQTAREEDAASVYGYTGTLGANSQGTSGQTAMEEDAASVYGYTGLYPSTFQLNGGTF